eukprot:11301_1
MSTQPNQAEERSENQQLNQRIRKTSLSLLPRNQKTPRSMSSASIKCVNKYHKKCMGNKPLDFANPLCRHDHKKRPRSSVRDTSHTHPKTKKRKLNTDNSHNLDDFDSFMGQEDDTFNTNTNTQQIPTAPPMTNTLIASPPIHHTNHALPIKNEKPVSVNPFQVNSNSNTQRMDISSKTAHNKTNNNTVNKPKTVPRVTHSETHTKHSRRSRSPPSSSFSRGYSDKNTKGNTIGNGGVSFTGKGRRRRGRRARNQSYSRSSYDSSRSRSRSRSFSSGSISSRSRSSSSESNKCKSNPQSGTTVADLSSAVHAMPIQHDLPIVMDGNVQATETMSARGNNNVNEPREAMTHMINGIHINGSNNNVNFFLSESGIVAEILKTHNFKCAMCPNIYTTKQALKRHENATHTTQRHICNICDKQFKYKSTMQRHVLDLHS